MRTLVILISLVLFFLTGFVMGMDRTHQENDEVSHVAEDVSDSETMEARQVVVEQERGPDHTKEIEEQGHFTQKAATFLESGVKGFFELIVNMAYQLVRVFF
ncbi:hypothetical protein [Lentibacillus amyloliquefaciens]|uniref:Uncharacterized protein n=1 Tax=Lentibacillus amyloliquefaciens TaxID=1472767 RepID=A0A0U4F3H7_9BACI|nr:hypothetical protein [Lentibacillus amyloliquefaciens]ALX48134.1 hypothetical protein AOX59_05665 [Lentibacillus amyloliquefaciens]